MWKLYKRTFIWVQLFVLIICLTFHFAGHAAWEALIGPVLVMEIGAIYGAKWAMRLKRMMGESAAEKPLLKPLT